MNGLDRFDPLLEFGNELLVLLELGIDCGCCLGGGCLRCLGALCCCSCGKRCCGFSLALLLVGELLDGPPLLRLSLTPLKSVIDLRKLSPMITLPMCQKCLRVISTMLSQMGRKRLTLKKFPQLRKSLDIVPSSELVHLKGGVLVDVVS